MQIVGLGAITVTTAGTAVPLSLTPLPVHKVVIRPESANAGVLKVLDSAGTLVAQLPKPPTTGQTDSFEVEAPGGNQIDLATIQVDAVTSGDKAVVYYVKN